MPVPTYLPFYVLIGSVAIILAILFGLRKALADAAWPEYDRNGALRSAAVILIGWFLLATILGIAGAYRAAPDRIPTLQYGIFIPILIGAWWIWRSPALGRIIDAVPQPWLVGVQFYRALGVIFLILYATGKLPGLFAWPAGVGDIIVGLLAPFVALAYARAPRRNEGLVTAWNVFGLLDLVVAVAAGFLTSPSILVSYDPPNELISIFPLVLIPVFLVPLSVLLHVASLTKLRRGVAGQSMPAPVGLKSF